MGEMVRAGAKLHFVGLQKLTPGKMRWKDDEENDNPDAISFEQGLAKAKEIGAVKYLGMFFAQLVAMDCVTNNLERMLCGPKPWYQGKLL